MGELEPPTTSGRRTRIQELLHERGSVRVADLVKLLGVTDTSIRRDLAVLEEEGLLKRVHGGAVSFPTNLRARWYSEKLHMHLAQKERIGAAAAKLVNGGDILIVDSGTTTLQVIANIPASLRVGGMLTVVTNSLPLSKEMQTWPSPNLIILGGLYLPDYQATVGPHALEDLSHITADKAFLGADGLTLSEGITTGHILMADLDRMMAERARQVILTADSSKLGHAGLIQVIAVKQVHMLITDRDAPPDLVEAIRAEGVEVELV